MNPEDFPTPEVAVETVQPETLKERIDAGEDVTLLDARMQSDYEEWRVDGDTVESINVPYFHFLEDEDRRGRPRTDPRRPPGHRPVCERRRQRVRRGHARGTRVRREPPRRRHERLGGHLRSRRGRRVRRRRHAGPVSAPLPRAVWATSSTTTMRRRSSTRSVRSPTATSPTPRNWAST